MAIAGVLFTYLAVVVQPLLCSTMQLPATVYRVLPGWLTAISYHLDNASACLLPFIRQSVLTLALARVYRANPPWARLESSCVCTFVTARRDLCVSIYIICNKFVI